MEKMNLRRIPLAVASVLLVGSLAMPVARPPAPTVLGVPAAPTNLTVTVAGPTQVNLIWADNSADETGFRLERAIASNFIDGRVNFAIGAEATSFNDISAAPSQAYFYRAVAVNAAGDSPPSNVVTATTPASGAGAPSAPTGLAATVSGGKILLTWVDTSVNETAFRIERCDNSGFPPKSILPIVVGSNAASVVDTTVPPNTSVFFRLFAVNYAGQSMPSNTVQVTTATIVPAGPAAPSGLTATAIGPTQVNLAWVDNSNDETGFRIERAVNINFIDGIFKQSIGANSTTFSDVAVPANQNFFYRVLAFGPAGDSAPSNVATVTTPASVSGAPASPSNLKATVSGGKVTLTWVNNATNTTNIRIERCDNRNFPPKSILPFVVGGTQTTVTDTNPPPNTTDFFRAIAVNGNGESVPSNVVEVQVPADTGITVSLAGLLASLSLKVDNNGNALEGSQLKDLDGDFSMNIARGTRMLTIDGKPITSLTYQEVYSPPVADGVVVLYAGEAGPSGARFEPPMTAIYHYAQIKMPQFVTEDKLLVAYWNGTGWSSLPSVIDTKSKTVTVSLSHFTLFALMASVPPPPLPPAAPPIVPVIPPAATAPPPSTILTEPAKDTNPPPPPPPSTILTEPPKDKQPEPPVSAPAASNVPWAIVAAVIAAAVIIGASVLVAMRKRRA